jgi:hypothetical protein
MMSEFLSKNPSPVESARLDAVFALFEAARSLIDVDTSQDPYHKIFRSFIEETDRRPAGRILEVGSRARSGNVYKGCFRNYSEYVGLDIIDGENVEEAMKGLCQQRANLGISVIARKIGPSDRRLTWDVDVSEILKTSYPSSRPQ